MPKNLVIVESPAKAKTIGKYLGPEFEVLASYGHVRDLVPKEGAVDPANGFAMKYKLIEKNEKHVNAIVRALKKSDALYLATDPDREGEAISWHLTELLREKKALNGKPVYRVVFHEITRNAIQEAIAHPRDISGDLVSAQQARRALDYLVGFNLSPLLWKKVQRGLSAEPRVADDRRARARDRGVQGARVLVHRSRRQQAGPAVRLQAGSLSRREGRAIQFQQRGAGTRGRAHHPGGGGREADDRQCRQEKAPPEPRCPIHDVDIAAGSIP
jgi:reverse gyrase